MQLYNVKTRQVEEVAEPSAAILSGSYVGDQNTTYTFANPEDGGIYEASGIELPEIVRAGGILESVEGKRERLLHEKAANSPATAAAFGAANALSFGGASVAANLLGVEQEVKALKEENPYAYTLGEVGGIVVPTLLTGGVGLVGQVARGATVGTRGVTAAGRAVADTVLPLLGVKTLTKTAAGKIVETLPTKLLGSAVEGAIYGEGKALSEKMLGEPANVGENVLIGAGLGALIPGIGAVASGVGKLAKFGVEKGLPLAASITSPASSSQLAKFFEMSKAGSETRGLVFRTTDALKNRIVELGREVDNVARVAGKFFKETKFARVDEMLAGVPIERVSQSVFDDVMAQSGGALRTIRQSPEAFSGSASGELQKATDVFTKTWSKAKSASEAFKALDEYAARLATAAKVGKVEQTAADIATSKLIKSVREKVVGNLTDERIWGKAAAMQQELNSAYSQFSDAQKAFNKYFRSKAGATSEVDAKKILSFAKNANKPEAQDAAQALDDYLSKAESLRNSLFKHGGASAEDSARQLGLSKKLSGDIDTLWQYHTMGGTKLPFSLELLNPGGKFAVQALGAAERVMAKVNTQWMSDLDGAFKALSHNRVGSVVGLSTSNLADTLDRSREVLTMAANPEMLAQRISSATGQLQLAAPQAAQAAQVQLGTAVQFLASKAPGNPTQGLSGPDPDWRPSDSELYRFQRYADAVERPQRMLEDFQAGRLSAETVEAVKTVYPNYYKQTVQAVVQYLGESTPKVSSHMKQQLSTLLQKPADAALQPKALLSLQMSFVQQKQGQQQGGQMKPVPSSVPTPGQGASRSAR